MRDWFFKGVLPLAFFAFLLYVFKGIYYVDGRVDWFWLWMTAGIPFGMLHFFVVIIPVNTDLTMTLGVVFFYFLMCGVFGGFIALATLIKAILMVISCPTKVAKR